MQNERIELCRMISSYSSIADAILFHSSMQGKLPVVTIHSALKIEKDQHMRVNENIGPVPWAPYSNSS